MTRLCAVYLYGSAVRGGLRPGERPRPVCRLSADLRPTASADVWSSSCFRSPAGACGQQEWRPVELTLVVESDIKPWRYPPRTEFQYGEWLRDRFDAGDVDPEDPNNPDLAVLIEMVRRTGSRSADCRRPRLLPTVPAADLRLRSSTSCRVCSRISTPTRPTSCSRSRGSGTRWRPGISRRRTTPRTGRSRDSTPTIRPAPGEGAGHLRRHGEDDDWRADLAAGQGHRPIARSPDQAARQTLNTIGAHVEQVPRRRYLRDPHTHRLR